MRDEGSKAERSFRALVAYTYVAGFGWASTAGAKDERKEVNLKVKVRRKAGHL